MEPQEIHTVVLQEEDLNQADIDNDDGEGIEYAEMTSEVEDEESITKGEVNDDDDDEESTAQIHTVPFDKVGRLGF